MKEKYDHHGTNIFSPLQFRSLMREHCPNGSEREDKNGVVNVRNRDTCELMHCTTCRDNAIQDGFTKIDVDERI